VLRELRQSFEVQRPGIDVDTYVTVDVDVRGKYDEHRFDLQLENGHPLDLVRGLAKKTQEEIDSVAWAIDDLQKADNHVPVTVVSIGSGKLLDSAERIYGDLGARLVREREVDQWCEAATGKLLTALAG
jgi:hypothetical protein